jgi:hypothetical protein
MTLYYMADSKAVRPLHQSLGEKNKSGHAENRREKVAPESAPAASELHGSKGRIEHRRGSSFGEERSWKRRG